MTIILSIFGICAVVWVIIVVWDIIVLGSIQKQTKKEQEEDE